MYYNSSITPCSTTPKNCSTIRKARNSAYNTSLKFVVQPEKPAIRDVLQLEKNCSTTRKGRNKGRTTACKKF